jgi:hypothetical protein
MKPLEDYLHSQGWEAPACRVQEWGPRQARWCVCIFVLNEGPRIRAQLQRMRPHTTGIDVVVADGGSTDGALPPDQLTACGVRAVLTKLGPGRLSTQMRMALAYSLFRGYDGAIVMDGNNKDDPAALPEFVRLLEAGFDHVQGSRYITGGQGINTPWVRHFAVRWVHAPLISWAAGVRCTDTTNGFRAYSRRLLTDERVAPFRDVFVGYELHYYLAIRAAQLGMSVCETPVTRAYPALGPMPTKIRGLKGNWLILETLWKAIRHRYDPPASAPTCRDAA